MLTRREAITAAVAVLLALAALLSGCSTPPESPAELPHYPCERAENGRTVYYACSDQEWVQQQILRGKS